MKFEEWTRWCEDKIKGGNVSEVMHDTTWTVIQHSLHNRSNSELSSMYRKYRENLKTIDEDLDTANVIAAFRVWVKHIITALLFNNNTDATARDIFRRACYTYRKCNCDEADLSKIRGRGWAIPCYIAMLVSEIDNELDARSNLHGYAFVIDHRPLAYMHPALLYTAEPFVYSVGIFHSDQWIVSPLQTHEYQWKFMEEAISSGIEKIKLFKQNYDDVIAKFSDIYKERISELIYKVDNSKHDELQEYYDYVESIINASNFNLQKHL